MVDLCTDHTSKKWGSLGDEDGKDAVVFEFLKSPEYQSVRTSRSAEFSRHERIITIDSQGKYVGQKPIKQVGGLSLIEWTFSCKISSFVLQAIKSNTRDAVAKAAGLGGVIAGGAFSDVQEDRRFYTEISTFVKLLNTIHDEQKSVAFFIGQDPQGSYDIDSLNMGFQHYPDGCIKIANIDIVLTENINNKNKRESLRGLSSVIEDIF